jgi:hypothetical protein
MHAQAKKQDLIIVQSINNMYAQVKKHNLKLTKFRPKRGQALIWHAGLIHGGSIRTDKTKTRKSLVVHYDKLRKHRWKSSVRQDTKDGKPSSYSAPLLRHKCMYAFSDPLVHYDSRREL